MINKCMKIILLITLLFIEQDSYALTSKIRLNDTCEPLTSLNINGKKVERLLIDTGAMGGIHLRESVITSLPGNPANYVKKDRYSDALGIVRHAKFFLAPQLIINGDRMNNVPLTTFSMWGNQHERQNIEPINGVIGLDTFGDNVLIIDLQKLTLEVTTRVKLDKQREWEKLPITRTEYGIELYAVGDAGRRLRLVLDTGANRSVLFAKESEKNRKSITEVVTGKNVVIKVIRDGFDAPELARGGIDGVIGCDYFKGKRLIIDKKSIYVSTR